MATCMLPKRNRLLEMLNLRLKWGNRNLELRNRAPVLH